MTYHRQELTFRAAGRFSLVTRGAQFLFNLAAALSLSPRHDHTTHSSEKRIQFLESLLFIPIWPIGQTDESYHFQSVVNWKAQKAVNGSVFGRQSIAAWVTCCMICDDHIFGY